VACAHPFATIVTADLRATHMPCLVDEDADGLVLLGHVARPDPVSEGIGGPLLMIFQGPHGYVSASWYESDTIPTWNHVTLHVRGTPERLPDPLPVLERTVDHFEAAVEQPWSLRRMGQTAREIAEDVIALSPMRRVMACGGQAVAGQAAGRARPRDRGPGGARPRIATGRWRRSCAASRAAGARRTADPGRPACRLAGRRARLVASGVGS